MLNYQTVLQGLTMSWTGLLLTLSRVQFSALQLLKGGKKQPKWIIISTIVKALVTNVRITTFFGCFDIPRYPHAMNNMNRYHLCFSNITGPLVTGSLVTIPLPFVSSASGHAALLTLDRPLMTAAARCGAQNLQGGSISGWIIEISKNGGPPNHPIS
jgi:hypothetical protein